MLEEIETVLEKELKTWKGFEEALRSDDRNAYAEMMAHAKQYAEAVERSGKNVTVEPLFMAILLAQHRMIVFLHGEVQKMKREISELGRGVDT